jgi:uncharacterized protein (TIGR02231 family)
LAAPAHAETLRVESSRIIEVTVFADRAEVVREARVDLLAGASELAFERIPFEVETDSFRVSAKGVAATLGAVEIREQAEAPVETPDLEFAQREVKRIENELVRIDLQDKVAEDLREFLTSIKAATAKAEGENLAAGKADPASIQAVFALLQKNLGDLSEASLGRGAARDKLRKELDVARAKLAAVRPPGAIRTRSAVVEVHAKQAGVLTLRLAYLVRGAAWHPSYRASLDADRGEVTLVSEATVRQRTGEDWSAVALRLSTAAPASGVEPPFLTSVVLRPVDVAALREEDKANLAYDSDLPLAGRYYQNVLTQAPGVAAEPAPPTPSEVETAAVIHSAYNVAFEVPGSSDVPADGAEHRVVLRNEALSARVEYRTAPEINPAAFLVAIGKAPADYPLLAGPVRVFAAGAYLGSFGLAETGPNAELTLPFGVDNRVKVERVRLPQDRSTEGITGKTRQIAYAFKTTLENLRDQKVTVTLEDLVPVSEDERIEVTIDRQQTTSGSKESERRPGVLLWAVELAPREKRELRLAYTVRHPKDLFVPGLE